VTEVVELLLKLGSKVKSFPRESERVADLRSTLTVALLPELICIVPRLSVGEVTAARPDDSELFALVDSIGRLVVACKDALNDSITSAVICPIAIF